VASSLTPLLASLEAAVQDLRGMKCSFALVGGLAVSVRSNPRFTRDADLAVAVTDDAHAESIVFGLLGMGYVLDATLEQTGLGRLATVRLLSPTKGRITVDLLFASSGIEPELVASAEIVTLAHNIRLPVATVGHLMALKLLSSDEERRRQDLIDLDELKRVATEADWLHCAEACALIKARGFHRQRDLPALMLSLRQSA
jgi:predicted nucleotidyltransferase